MSLQQIQRKISVFGDQLGGLCREASVKGKEVASHAPIILEKLSKYAKPAAVWTAQRCSALAEAILAKKEVLVQKAATLGIAMPAALKFDARKFFHACKEQIGQKCAFVERHVNHWMADPRLQPLKMRVSPYVEKLSPKVKETVGKIYQIICKLLPLIAGLAVAMLSRAVFFPARIPSVFPFVFSSGLGFLTFSACGIYRLAQDDEIYKSWKTGGLKGVFTNFVNKLSTNRVAPQHAAVMNIEDYLYENKSLFEPNHIILAESEVDEIKRYLETLKSNVHKFEKRIPSYSDMQNFYYQQFAKLLMHYVGKKDEAAIKVLVQEISDATQLDQMAKALLLKEYGFRLSCCLGLSDAFCDAFKAKIREIQPTWVIDNELLFTDTVVGGSVDRIQLMLDKVGYLSVDRKIGRTVKRPDFTNGYIVRLPHQNYSAIQLASIHGSESIANLLLPKVQEWGELDVQGNSLLALSALSGNLETYKLFKAHQGKIEKDLPLKAQMRVLYNAICSGNVAIFEDARASFFAKHNFKAEEQYALHSSLYQHGIYWNKGDILKKIKDQPGFTEQMAQDSKQQLLVLQIAGKAGNASSFTHALKEVQAKKVFEQMGLEEKQGLLNSLLYSALLARRIDPNIVQSILKLGGRLSLTGVSSVLTGHDKPHNVLLRAFAYLSNKDELLIKILETIPEKPKSDSKFLTSDKDVHTQQIYREIFKKKDLALLQAFHSFLGGKFFANPEKLLNLAVSYGTKEMCLYLVAHGANPLPSEHSTVISPLERAIRKRDISLMTALLDSSVKLFRLSADKVKQLKGVASFILCKDADMSLKQEAHRSLERYLIGATSATTTPTATSKRGAPVPEVSVPVEPVPTAPAATSLTSPVAMSVSTESSETVVVDMPAPTPTATNTVPVGEPTLPVPDAAEFVDVPFSPVNNDADADNAEVGDNLFVQNAVTESVGDGEEYEMVEVSSENAGGFSFSGLGRLFGLSSK